MWANVIGEGRRERRSRILNMEPRFEVFNSWITPSKESKRGMTLIHLSVFLSSFFFSLPLSRNRCKLSFLSVYTQFISLRLLTHLVSLCFILTQTEQCWPWLQTAWQSAGSLLTLSSSCSVMRAWHECKWTLVLEKQSGKGIFQRCSTPWGKKTPHTSWVLRFVSSTSEDSLLCLHAYQLLGVNTATTNTSSSRQKNTPRLLHQVPTDNEEHWWSLYAETVQY